MENLNNKLEESVFGDNKYYVEIIKGFIEGYPKDTTRVLIDKDRVELKVNDMVGSKTITFKKLNDEKIKVNLDKNADLIRYQDTIIYDSHGIMMERSSCMAIINSNVNQKVSPNDLALELNNLGENLSGRASEIYQSVNLKKVTRPENYALDGDYLHKRIVFHPNGNVEQDVVQGTFKVLNSKSISSLDFPNEDDVLVTNSENFIQEDSYEIPTSRSL